MRTIVLLFLVTACSPAQRAWHKAKRVDTVEGYRTFVREQPAHPRRGDALKRVEQLDWEHAMTRNSSEAWGNFLAFHASSTRIAEARTHAEAALWRETVEADTRQAYDLYLGMHPMGPNASEARTKLEALAWRDAEADGTVDGYGRYLVRHRDGEHAEEASRRREELIWGQAVAADGPLEYRAYLERYPQGIHASEARAIVDGFRFSGVAVRLVIRRTERADSLKTWQPAIMETFGRHLTSERFTVAWLEPVDARGKPELDPLDGLLLAVPENHAAIVIELEETRGREFAPAGAATDMTATVHLVPPGRVRPMATKTVKATTSARVTVPNEAGLHLDAQREFGKALGKAGFPFRDWLR